MHAPGPASRAAWAVVAPLLFALAGCGPGSTAPGVGAGVADPGKAAPVPESVGAALFKDITATTGIDHAYRNGEENNHLAILESLGGGVGVLDFDRDGLPDLFLPGGGGYAGADRREIVGNPSRLYRNLGGGKFQDVTATLGLDRLGGGAPWFFTHGVAVGDFDRDGWPDLLVTGWGRVALLRNAGGRRFEDVTARAGLDKGILWTVSAAWADFNGDGWPDLYCCQYVDWSWKNNPKCNYDGNTPDVCPPKNFAGLPHKVFRNKGDGTFADVSDSCGLKASGPDSGKGLGVLAVDLNEDGKPDVYVCNDTVDNFLYMNRSTPGTILFEEMGMRTGVARDDRGGPNGSMGVDAGDYDGVGKPAVWVTNYENELHALYRNMSRKNDRGDHVMFNFQTTAAGIAAIGQKYVGWGTNFVDFDLDGWEDLFVSNGHAIRYPKGKGVTRRQKPVLLLNRGGGKFLQASKRLGDYGESEHLGRGVGFVDLDNDGRVEMVFAHLNDPSGVVRNVSDPGNHWLGVALVGAKFADVVGARVVLEADGRKQTRFAKGGGSYASSGDRRLVFGLGKAEKVDRVTVTWPDGKSQEWKSPRVDQYHTLQQAAP